eukprot:Colp12_sorted_trinity150504_noHs@17760
MKASRVLLSFAFLLCTGVVFSQQCVMETGMDYWADDLMKEVTGVPDPGACCDLCTNTPTCVSWVYSSRNNGSCYMKKTLRPNPTPCIWCVAGYNTMYADGVNAPARPATSITVNPSSNAFTVGPFGAPTNDWNNTFDDLQQIQPNSRVTSISLCGGNQQFGGIRLTYDNGMTFAHFAWRWERDCTWSENSTLTLQDGEFYRSLFVRHFSDRVVLVAITTNTGRRIFAGSARGNQYMTTSVVFGDTHDIVGVFGTWGWSFNQLGFYLKARNGPWPYSTTAPTTTTTTTPATTTTTSAATTTTTTSSPLQTQTTSASADISSAVTDNPDPAITADSTPTAVDTFTAGTPPVNSGIIATQVGVGAHTDSSTPVPTQASGLSPAATGAIAATAGLAGGFLLLYIVTKLRYNQYGKDDGDVYHKSEGDEHQPSQYSNIIVPV